MLRFLFSEPGYSSVAQGWNDGFGRNVSIGIHVLNKKITINKKTILESSGVGSCRSLTGYAALQF